MGYRSDIYIKVTNDIAPDLYLTLQQADCIDYAEFSEDDNYTYITMNDLKWYDSYDDVSLVNDELDGFADSSSTSRGTPRLQSSHPELFV